MKKHNFLWLLMAAPALGIILVLVRWGSHSATAVTVFRLDFTSQNCPVDGTQFYHSVFKTQLAPVAMDRAGNFYVVARKRHQGGRGFAEQVIKADTKGRFIGVFPLSRKDGRPVLGCDYFSVSSSGNYWWTARKPFEDSSNLSGTLSRNWIVTVYDSSGKPLQEWRHVLDVGEGLLQATGKDESYFGDEGTLEKGQVWIYKVGEEAPTKKPFGFGQHLTPDGLFWLLRHNMPPTNPLHYTASVTEMGKRSKVAYRFDMPEPATIFWHDAQSGLFLFSYLQESGTTVFDRAKVAYRVDAKGTVHKLFVTSNVLKTKPSEQVRTGQLLKADANFVWMEVEYFKGNKVTEYQIVKVPY